MKKEIEKKSANDETERMTFTRRNILKALVGLPVLGIFAYKLLEKRSADQAKKQEVLDALGIKELKQPALGGNGAGKRSDLLRIGIIGFGERAHELAKGLGYIHPDHAEEKKRTDTLADWLAQENLNVALSGICEVFNLRAEQGLVAARNELQPGGGSGADIPVKRYGHYHEMLESNEIDAVIIATPEHQHAQMIIDAARAGKHVYCEKTMTRTESELYEVYQTVKDTGIAFQLGHQVTKSIVFQQAKQLVEKDILGKISLIETTTNRNTARGAWIRHIDGDGNPKPGDERSIDWNQWLGSRPKVPFSADRYYNWTKWFDYSTGLIGQLFSHAYDRVNQLLSIGIPGSAVATGGIYYWKDNREIPDVLQATFEYPTRDLALLYSATLSSSRERGTVIMGHDASLTFGDSMQITADYHSTRFKEKIAEGIIDPTLPMFSYNPGSGKIDAVTSATDKYYASRGLTYNFLHGRFVDVTHLHIKEWLDCIRYGGETTANIERAFEEGVTCQMAHKSYLEKRRVEWDPVQKVII